jgi:hypothetical protein
MPRVLGVASPLGSTFTQAEALAFGRTAEELRAEGARPISRFRFGPAHDSGVGESNRAWWKRATSTNAHKSDAIAKPSAGSEWIAACCSGNPLRQERT